MEGIQSMENGTISIKEGHVEVRDPGEGGRKASISPCPNIKIYVDGVLINSRTEVTSENKISLVPEEIPGEYKLSVQADKKKMEAYLSIDYSPGKTYFPINRNPVTDLEDIICETREAHKKALTVEEVRKELNQRGIVYGIDAKAIESAIFFADGQGVLVASGTEPEPGEDARIEVFFQEGKYLEKNVDDLWVDNFDYGTLASAEAGMVVARKVPVKPGKPGMDISARKIEPPQPKDVQMKAGPGVEISKNGLEAIALVNGRPQLKGNTVSVTPQYKINGDVDNTTGNLNFAGDVVVEGSVQDAMKVRSGGNVKILGFATHCYIEARGDVNIAKNVVGCEIKAGGSKVDLYPIKESLISLSTDFTNLLNVLEQFMRDPRIKDRPEVQKYGFGAMLKILLDTKFPQMARRLKELQEMIEALFARQELIFDEGIRIVVGRLRQRFTGTGPLEFKTTDEIFKSINDFLKTAQDGLERIENALVAKSSIYLGYVQHSKLEATGNIVVNGKGCYNTNIICGGSVIVKDRKGFFRGGEIKAGGDVNIYEIGSPGGAPTTVEVPSNRAINCAATHEGVVLRVGKSVKTVGTKAGDL